MREGDAQGQVSPDGWDSRSLLGFALMMGSTLLWLALPALAWLPVSLGQKTALGVGLFILIEITFYGGALVAGRQVARRWARFLPSGWLDRFAHLLEPRAEPGERGSDSEDGR